MDDLIIRDEPSWKREMHRSADELRFPPRKFVHFEGDTISLDSAEQRDARQRAYYGWLVEQDFELFITVKFNESLRPFALRDRTKRLAHLFDAYWLGHYWSIFSPDERTFFIASIEFDRGGTGVHAHILLLRPRKVRQVSLGQWKIDWMSNDLTSKCRRAKICPYGDVRVARYALRVAEYVVKDFHELRNQDECDFIIMSTEFL